MTAGLLVGCGEPNPVERAEGERVEATTTERAEPEPEPPPPPGAFELPGLRERAPRPRLGWPVESVHLTSSFGWRVDPVSGRGTRLHRGIDLRGSTGDLVLSIGPGRVAFVGHDPLLGNMVVIDHGDGLKSLYGHLSDVLVVGEVPVDRGAAIGLVGNTGRSAATHLHLTVTLDGQAIDPLEVLGEPPHRPAALAAPLDASTPNEPPVSAPDLAGDEVTPPESKPETPPSTAAPERVAPEPTRPATHPLPNRSDDGGPS